MLAPRTTRLRPAGTPLSAENERGFPRIAGSVSILDGWYQRTRIEVSVVAIPPAGDAATPTAAFVSAGAGEPPGADMMGQAAPVKFHDELLRTLPQHAMRPPSAVSMHTQRASE